MLLIALLASSWADAQDHDFTIGVDVRRVPLYISVVDRDQHIVSGLTRESFQVFENDQPQEIKEFAQEDVPVSIGILIDNSGSMRDKRVRVNAAALEFVKASNPNDEVFIVNFNDEAYLDCPFTSNPERLQDALQRIDSRSGTALYDAIDMSLEYMGDKAKLEKRVLLVVSDGEDNASRDTMTLERLVRRLQGQEGVMVYAVGLLGGEQKRAANRAERALNYITRATGGAAHFPEAVDGIDTLVRQIAQDIRNQYVLTYRPPEGSPAGFRRIKVDLVGKAKRNTVRHRPGYFADDEARN